MDAKDTALEEAVIEFYREEIRQRYQLDRMRQVKQFGPISDEMLKALRDFFLERMYPPREMRAEFHAAFDDIGHLLRSPTRLGPLLRASLMSMLRLGAHLPAALSAGIAAVDALRETRKLETSMLEAAHRLEIGPEHATERQTMLRIIAGLPEETVRKLINDVLRLFEALSDLKMLSGMLRIMERVMATMEARPQTYTDEDRRSIALGLEVLQGGHDLFMQIKPKDFPRLIKGIESIELAWYRSVRKEAGESGPSE
jgi:hypothetical protein